MKLEKRVSLVWCLVAGIYLVFMSFGTLVIKNKYEEQKRAKEESKIEALIGYYLSSKEETLMKIVTTHSYWSEFRSAVLKRDTLWIAENAAEYLLEGYDIDSVYILSENSGYSEIKGEISAKDYNSLSSAEIESGRSKLVFINNRIYLLCWAPIADNERQNPIGTYFIGGRVELDELTEFLRGVSFIPISVELQKETGSDKKVIIPLNREINLAVGYELPEFEKNIKQVFIYIVGGVVFVSLLLFGIFLKYIKSITTQISKVVGSIGLISNGDYSETVTLGRSDEAVVLAESINKLSQSIRDKVKEIEEGYNDSLKLLIKTVEVNDNYTKGHSERVAYFSKALGKVVGYKEIDTLEQGALLHDIGKIATPKSVLNKRGKLSPCEYEIIKSHPGEGEKILGVAPSFMKIKELVLCHHERVDGSGYPMGIRGDEIPLGARIIAVADVFDSITSDRPYRRALDLPEALAVMKKEGKKGLDNRLVEEFLLIAEELYKKEKTLGETGRLSIEKEKNIV